MIAGVLWDMADSVKYEGLPLAYYPWQAKASSIKGQILLAANQGKQSAAELTYPDFTRVPFVNML
jgi:hypothetical protein